MAKFNAWQMLTSTMTLTLTTTQNKLILFEDNKNKFIVFVLFHFRFAFVQMFLVFSSSQTKTEPIKRTRNATRDKHSRRSNGFGVLFFRFRLFGRIRNDLIVIWFGYVAWVFCTAAVPVTKRKKGRRHTEYTQAHVKLIREKSAAHEI